MSVSNASLYARVCLHVYARVSVFIWTRVLHVSECLCFLIGWSLLTATPPHTPHPLESYPNQIRSKWSPNPRPLALTFLECGGSIWKETESGHGEISEKRRAGTGAESG